MSTRPPPIPSSSRPPRNSGRLAAVLAAGTHRHQAAKTGVNPAEGTPPCAIEATRERAAGVVEPQPTGHQLDPHQAIILNPIDRAAD